MHRFPPALPGFVAVGLLALSTSASWADEKYITPGDCQPYGQTSDYTNMPIRADGIRNTTTNTNKYVICPVTRDQAGPWVTAGDAASVDIFFNYAGNGSITCTLTEGQDYDGLVPSNAVSLNAVPAIGSIRMVEFTPFGVGAFGATITCRLPPGAKMLSIRMNEEGVTD